MTRHFEKMQATAVGTPITTDLPATRANIFFTVIGQDPGVEHWGWFTGEDPEADRMNVYWSNMLLDHRQGFFEVSQVKSWRSADPQIGAAPETTGGDGILRTEAQKEQEFTKELENLVNRYSMENGSNTPDFVLGEYLMDCLRTFNKATAEREKYYGRGTVSLDVDSGVAQLEVRG